MLIIVLFFFSEWLKDTEGAFLYFNIYLFGLIPLLYDNFYSNEINIIKNNKYNSKRFEYYYIIKYGTIIGLILIISTNAVTFLLPIESLDKNLNLIYSNKGSGNNENSFYTFLDKSTKLGGPINIDNTILLYVESDKKVYLRGSIKDTYTGYSWINSNKKFYKADDNLINEEYSSYKNFNKITIYPKNLITRTLFTPLKPIFVEIKGKDVYYDKNYELYYDNRLFNTKVKSYTIYSFDYFNNESISDEYLQVPRIPKRVELLAYEITNDKINDFEKMKALEYYLSHNYFYTRDVSIVPENVDFVDYFLFEEKKGYCTYYATSLAILGRIIGIPTRYVEGFLLPDTKNELGIYEVTNENAHAWVEAYINGKGWMTFEATSIYNIDLLREKEQKESVSNKDQNNLNIDNKDLEKILDLGEIVEKNNDLTENRKSKITLIISILVIFINFFTLVLYKKKIKNIDNLKRCKQIFRVIIYLVLKFKIIEDNNYTVEEIIYKISEKLFSRKIDDNIIKILNKVLYSKNLITDLEVIDLLEFKKKFELNIIRKYGKIRFIIYKYILGKLTNYK